MTVVRKGLGRGLSALMDELDAAPAEVAPASDPSAPRPAATVLPITLIDPNSRQPRRRFDAAAMAELADSIRVKGVLQPLLVRPMAGGRYEIVAGERRWRAAQMAGLHEVPVLVRNLVELDAFEAAIIENVQRADLNPMEEAQGYQRLIRDFGHTQEMVAAAVGKARSHVANLLRLLDLPESVQALVRDGQLSLGHAKAVLASDHPEALARQIVAEGLTVRAAEAAAKGGRASPQRAAPRKASATRNADVAALEAHLSEALGLKVAIEGQGTRGVVKLAYSDLDQLDLIIGKLQG
ncbi:MAG: ParB/RepB/Spo0J family partition protein [Sphingomonadaceae bacterium]